VKTMKNRWVLVLIAFLVFAITLAGGFTLLWRFMIFVAVVLGLSYLWSRLSIRNLESRINEIPALCRVGDRFVESATITNRRNIPTPLLEISEDTSLPYFRNGVSVSLPSKGYYNWQTEVHCRRRGRYGLGTFTVKTTDPLGIFSLKRHIGERQEFLVYPSIHDLPFFELSPQQEFGTGSRRWLTRESSPNASRVREYISGDNLRHIHWLSTAHTGNLMVREYDPDRSRTGFSEMWLVPDMYRGSQLGENEETTEEYSISIAASLASKYLDEGKKVGMIAAGNKSYLLTPEAGEDQLQYILRSLSLLEAKGEVTIDSLLSSRAEHFQPDSIVVIIMPSLNPSIAASLRSLVDRRVKVITILLDSFSFGAVQSSTNSPRTLSFGSSSVYTVRQGMEITRALDSRLATTRIQ
jgi:uncharacterized protein (DUF58 family)